MNNDSKRVYGLDIFRSIAVIFVLMGHSFQHSVLPDWVASAGRLGMTGVELFFVLSGFLIGGILLKLLEQGRLHSISDVTVFWSRRWLRTLPMYVIALLLWLRFDYHGRHQLFDYASYWIFMQNFAWPIPDFFGVSWSLAVEEHFYFWFPLLFLVAYKLIKRSELSLLAVVLLIFVIVVSYRLYLPFYNDWDAFNFQSRMVVLSRLDAIMFGVLIAAIKRYQGHLYSMIRSLTPIWSLFAVIVVVWHYLGLPAILTNHKFQITAQSMQCLVFSLLIPWFDGVVDRPSTGSSAFFTLTSRISYSLYLLHILVIVMVNSVIEKIGQHGPIYTNALVLYTLYFSGFYVAGWAGYKLVEEPFLSLRDQSLDFRTGFKKVVPAMLIAAALIFIA